MSMTDSEILEKYKQPLPVSFKVIGTGTGVADIIEKVKSFGYDCIDCILAKTPGDCIPVDDDKMAIIVARDNEEIANAIAKTYHDAGVLTIGLVYDPDIICYDKIASDTSVESYPDVIKHLLQPIANPGLLSYDFYDLCVTLRDFRFFKILVSEGKKVEIAVNAMKEELAKVPMQHVESLSALLFFNRERQSTITVTDIKHLSAMISSLPESINVRWTVNVDDTLPYDLIRFSIIISGNEL